MISEWKLQTIVATFLSRALPDDAYFTSIDAGQGKMDAVSGAIRKNRGIKAGVGDVLTVYRGQAIFLELKTQVGTLSPSQKRFSAEIERAGAMYFVCRSVEDVERCLRDAAVPLRATSFPAAEYDARAAARVPGKARPRAKEASRRGLDALARLRTKGVFA